MPSLGDVEDDVGTCVAQPFGEVADRLEAHHLAQRAQRGLDGIDGRGDVPLGELVVGVRREGDRRLRGVGPIVMLGDRGACGRAVYGAGRGGRTLIVREGDARHAIPEGR